MPSRAILWINLGLTLYRAMAGFVIAAIGGIALATLMSRFKLVRWFFDPIISVGFPMPKIAFLPVIILWLGVYDVSKISIVVFDAIFPVVTATLAGIAAVEKELLWSARNMGANERELMWQIVLPAASPQILTGLQVALPIALIVEIIGEMVMGGYGLGGAMMSASRFANSPGVFAGIVEIAIVGFVADQGHGDAAPPASGMAPGSGLTKFGHVLGGSVRQPIDLRCDRRLRRQSAPNGACKGLATKQSHQPGRVNHARSYCGFRSGFDAAGGRRCARRTGANSCRLGRTDCKLDLHLAR